MDYVKLRSAKSNNLNYVTLKASPKKGDFVKILEIVKLNNGDILKNTVVEVIDIKNDIATVETIDGQFINLPLNKVKIKVLK